MKPRRCRAALEAVCLKAMALRPADRYASALDLAEDVERWLADEPVTAWREPAGVRLRRWVRKHARLVTGVAAALAVGTLTFGISAALLTAANSANGRRPAGSEKRRRPPGRRPTRNGSLRRRHRAGEKDTKQVLDFVENKIFGTARPEDSSGGLGTEVRLRDAIKAALPVCGNQFPGPAAH